MNGNNNEIKQMVREIMQPFFDEVIEISCRIYSPVYGNLPDSMSIEEKNSIVKPVLEKQCAAMIAGIKSSIPEDFEKQLKEAFNGGK